MKVEAELAFNLENRRRISLRSKRFIGRNDLPFSFLQRGCGFLLHFVHRI
jgi:hypothetical protein